MVQIKYNSDDICFLQFGKSYTFNLNLSLLLPKKSYGAFQKSVTSRRGGLLIKGTFVKYSRANIAFHSSLPPYVYNTFLTSVVTLFVSRVAGHPDLLAGTNARVVKRPDSSEVELLNWVASEPFHGIFDRRSFGSSAGGKVGRGGGWDRCETIPPGYRVVLSVAARSLSTGNVTSRRKRQKGVKNMYISLENNVCGTY